MSIRDVLRDQLTERRLFVLEPSVPGSPTARTMVLSKEVMDLLTEPWPCAAAARRLPRLRADLESFVAGEVISACLVPYKAKNAYMGRLDKPRDEVWDVRSRDPSPGLRILGRFAEQDVFVGLSCWPRSIVLQYLSRPPLLDGASKEWSDGIKECKAEWRRLFDPYPAHTGTEVHDYLSANVLSV